MRFFKELSEAITAKPEVVFQPHPGAKKVAILIMSMAPELCACLFEEMSPEQVQEITNEIIRIPKISSKQRIEITAEHLGVKLTENLLASPKLEEDLIAALQAYVRTDPKSAARSLTVHLHSWKRSEQGRPNKLRFELQRPRVVENSLNSAQKAAVLFMSLPPELSAVLFDEFEPETTVRLTTLICELPTVNPRCRIAVICEFLQLSPRKHTLKSATDTLQVLVKARPRRCAQFLGEMMS